MLVCEEKGVLCTVGGSVNWFNPCGIQYGDFSKSRNVLTNTSSNQQKNLRTPVFTAAEFVTDQLGEGGSPDV